MIKQVALLGTLLLTSLLLGTYIMVRGDISDDPEVMKRDLIAFLISALANIIIVIAVLMIPLKEARRR